MERVRKPLAQMGAQITLTDGHAPVVVRGSSLTAIDYTTPIPSAQVKTALLFAGLQAEGTTTVRESVRTRDHGELALRAFGAEVTRTLNSVSITGGQKLKAIEAAVPGDISSAAFFLCAAALFPESNLVLDGLGLNPTRATLLDVLTALGATIPVLNLEEKHGELIGTVQMNAPAKGLGGTTVSGALAAQLIDELPSARGNRSLFAQRHPHSRRQGAARERIGPHRARGREPARDGSRGRGIRRRPRRPRRPAASWRTD